MNIQLDTKIVMPGLQKEIEEHGLSVGKLAINVANELGLSKTAAHQIYISGVMHDIGKVQINQKVLMKPGRLTEEERKDIKLHAVKGALELQQIGYCSEIILNVLFHHKNFDGTGYHTSIKGDEIPLGARIIRVCDMYDALITDRVYRKKMSKGKALEIMESEKKNFDPDVYKAFMKIVGEFPKTALYLSKELCQA